MGLKGQLDISPIVIELNRAPATKQNADIPVVLVQRDSDAEVISVPS